MRKKGFTLTEMLICMLILLVLMSGISVLIKSDSTENVAAQDMDRLARWLNHAFARADRWKKGFYLNIYLSKSDVGSYMVLNWNDREDSPSETFYADSRLRWTYSADSQLITYNCLTHTVTPAFTMKAVLADSKEETSETLTLSVRALVTREQSSYR